MPQNFDQETFKVAQIRARARQPAELEEEMECSVNWVNVIIGKDFH